MKPPKSSAEQVEAILRIRDSKAKSVELEKDETGKVVRAKLVPYRRNKAGHYYDNEGRKWCQAVDPSGNLVPIMLSTSRDPREMDAGTELKWERKFSGDPTEGGWFPLERAPYGMSDEQWAKERIRLIDQRRAEAAERAVQEQPSQLEQLTALIRRDREERREMVNAGEVPKIRGKRAAEDAG